MNVGSAEEIMHYEKAILTKRDSQRHNPSTNYTKVAAIAVIVEWRKNSKSVKWLPRMHDAMSHD